MKTELLRLQNPANKGRIEIFLTTNIDKSGEAPRYIVAKHICFCYQEAKYGKDIFNYGHNSSIFVKNTRNKIDNIINL